VPFAKHAIDRNTSLPVLRLFETKSTIVPAA
jgi:hypothetical protein